MEHMTRGAGTRKRTSSSAPEPTVSADQLLDKYGHVHSEAVLRHWTPAALKALGIRRVGEKEGAQ